MNQSTSPTTPDPEVPRPKIGIIGKLSIVLLLGFVIGWPVTIIYLNFKQRTYVEHELADGLRAHYSAWQKGLEVEPTGAIGPADLIALGFVSELDYDRTLKFRELKKGTPDPTPSHDTSTLPTTQSGQTITASTQPAETTTKLPYIFSYGDFVFCYVGIKPNTETNDERILAFSRNMYGSEAGRFVLYGNGEVKWLPRSKFNATIQAENQVRLKADLAEIHYEATRW